MPFDVNHLSASSALYHLASLACRAELSLPWLTSKVRAVTERRNSRWLWTGKNPPCHVGKWPAAITAGTCEVFVSVTCVCVCLCLLSQYHCKMWSVCLDVFLFKVRFSRAPSRSVIKVRISRMEVDVKCSTERKISVCSKQYTSCQESFILCHTLWKKKPFHSWLTLNSQNFPARCLKCVQIEKTSWDEHYFMKS